MQEGVMPTQVLVSPIAGNSRLLQLIGEVPR